MSQPDRVEYQTDPSQYRHWTLRFEGPLGDFTLREGEAPILFVAGATGFAPIKSIVEDAFARGITRPMRLYWGVRKRTDLYAVAMSDKIAGQSSGSAFSVGIRHRY